MVSGVVAIGACSAPALAQFDEPVPTDWVSRIVGVITSESGAPVIDSQDEVAAIFNGEVIGLQRFSQPASGPVPIDFRIHGDDPATPEKEGPSVGEVVTFQFFDSSTGMIRSNVLAVNLQGEVSVFTFRGDNIDLDLPGAPLPEDFLIPVQEFDLRLTAQDNSTGDGGGGGEGGGGTGQGNPDVNADGAIDKRDVALVLRVVVGNTRSVTSAQRARADVNNDGRVTSEDAVLVFRAK